MKTEKIGLVPTLTSEAGGTLTAQNWHETGVKMVSCELSSLLMKPGFECLSKASSLASYVGWDGPIVLNASSLRVNHAGMFLVKSHYDGRSSSYSAEELLTLIASLKPDVVMLAEGFVKDRKWVQLPIETELFIPVSTGVDLFVVERSFGVFVSFDSATYCLEKESEFLALRKNRSCSVSCDLSLSVMKELIDKGAQWITTDRPSMDAYKGIVYTKEGEISIRNQGMSAQFTSVDDDCDCLTCAQMFTRAYLHHLFEQTPLLCQRLLVQHNVHYCQHALTYQL